MSTSAIKVDEIQNVYFSEDDISVEMQHAGACKRRFGDANWGCAPAMVELLLCL